MVNAGLGLSTFVTKIVMFSRKLLLGNRPVMVTFCPVVVHDAATLFA